MSIPEDMWKALMGGGSAKLNFELYIYYHTKYTLNPFKDLEIKRSEKL